MTDLETRSARQRQAPGALSELDQYLQMLREALTRDYRRLDQLLAKEKKRRAGP